MADNNQIPNVFAEVCELRRDCHDLQNDNAELRQQVEEQRGLIQRLEREATVDVKGDGDTVKRLSERVTQLKHKAKHEQSRADAATRRNDELSRINSSLAEQLNELRLNSQKAPRLAQQPTPSVDAFKARIAELERLNRGQQVRINLQKDKYETLRREYDHTRKELDRIIGVAKHRAERITELNVQVAKLNDQVAKLDQAKTFRELAAKRPGDEDLYRAAVNHHHHTISPVAQFLQVKLLEDVPKGVNALHAVGQVIGLLHVSRKDTHNIGQWLINSVEERD